MEKTLQELFNLIANNEVQQTLQKLQSIFSLADSELFNDAILLSARFKKLNSDVRKAIISNENETIRYNEIVHGILSLINEIKDNPKPFEKYDKVEEKVQQDDKAKTNVEWPVFAKDALVQRLSYIKQKEVSIKGLWIDDHPGNQAYEKELLSTIGVKFDTVLNSEQAWYQINHNEYDLIISDINRNGDPKAGLELLNKTVHNGLNIPFIFFAANINPALGTPPYAFGITNLIGDLLHLVMDVIERKN